MLQLTIKGYDLILATDPRLFSPSRLDAGTAAMLNVVDLRPGQRILDLGCGYGVVGIYAAKVVGAENVVMIDCDPLAVQLAKENANLNQVSAVSIYESEGFTGLKESRFDAILSNPPYHVDFSVPKGFIEKGFNRLVMGGKMYMVTKRQAWYRNKLIAIFGGVRMHEIDGYTVFVAEKRSSSYASKKKKSRRRED